MWTFNEAVTESTRFIAMIRPPPRYRYPCEGWPILARLISLKNVNTGQYGEASPAPTTLVQEECQADNFLWWNPHHYRKMFLL
jgi:hypothetical protein